ncbi:hypothetical protein EJJ20_24815 [Pseudomonas poae]|nr:hypothetical protein EJJ20_24815 [Pseudomonas poae]
MAQVTLRGNPVQVEGELPQVGSQAPEFTLTAGDLSDATLATFAAQVTNRNTDLWPTTNTL